MYSVCTNNCTSSQLNGPALGLVVVWAELVRVQELEQRRICSQLYRNPGQSRESQGCITNDYTTVLHAITVHGKPWDKIYMAVIEEVTAIRREYL